MIKVKALRPAHREKKRYLVYTIDSQKEIPIKKAHYELIKKVQETLGVFDAARAGILSITYNQDKQQGIIKLNHTAVQKVRACFVLITKLQDQPVSIQTTFVSGILKKAKLHMSASTVSDATK